MNTFKTAFASVAAAMLLAGATSAAQAQTVIDTTGGADKFEISSFGVGTTSTYGQTFTVGADNVLNAFSLYLNGAVSNPVQFKSYIYAWDGSKASGAALFASTLQQFNGGSDTRFAFDTTGLQLATGSRYVAFLSTAGLQAGRPSQAVQMPGVAEATYAGGSFVYDNNNNDFTQLTNSAWDCRGNCGFGDAFFKASLSTAVVAAVPEPASWAMMIVGVGAAGGSLRRRRGKVTTRVAYA